MHIDSVGAPNGVLLSGDEAERDPKLLWVFPWHQQVMVTPFTYAYQLHRNHVSSHLASSWSNHQWLTTAYDFSFSTQFPGLPMTLLMTPTRVKQISAIWLVMQHRENFYNFTPSHRPNWSSRNSLHPHRRPKDVPPLSKDGSTAATTWADQCQLQLALHGAKPFHCQWGSSS